MAHILLLDTYHGGSHAAFSRGWMHHSRHRFTPLTLPAHHWKWRMRHAAITFAEQLETVDETFDAVFATDMLNLAEFRGLAPRPIADLPTVVYFHENQLTYPDASAGERDLHYAMTNITAALAADTVWFNSTYHRDVFTTAARDFLANMPDHQPVAAVDRILEKSSIQPPGITPAPPRGPRAPGPLRIVWAARWEHDKDPEEFFDAMRALKARGVDFRLSVLGQQFDQTPACFAAARRDLAGHLDHFGYIESPAAYRQILQTRDVFVSTARHEFFGIAPMEAAATGCIPALPNRLSYPDLFRACKDFFYTDLPNHLTHLATSIETPDIYKKLTQTAQTIAQNYHWPARTQQMDQAIEQLTE